MLSVCLPGTGGFMPLGNRWLTCCWMEYQGRALLIDCGEGTQLALRAAGCRLSRLDTLLITHYHADHVAGLPGLLLSAGNSGKTTPLTIAGPPGLRYVVPALMMIAPVPYPVELVELGAGDALDGWDGLTVSSSSTASPATATGCGWPASRSSTRKRPRRSESPNRSTARCTRGRR